ncbi:HAD-IA family hydrolase [Hahella sp. SMD15-11]|uniref:HAD-IA family hydrolase n=1 Tax=Thermohahella caldifontis TaxID=3142973 RepID=A0AB39UYZ1_9GAMM
MQKPDVKRVRMVVFDWDGTLLDSTGHIVHALKTAADQLVWPWPGDDAARNIIGLGMRESIVALFGERSSRDIESFRKAYAEIFFSVTPTREDLFEGAMDTLERLRAAGYRLAIATGKSRPGLDRVLRGLDLAALFEITRCADESRSKPHPQMLWDIRAATGLEAHEMIMVGDTEYDLEMAQRAKVPAVAVGYGAHDPSRLIQWQPLAILERMTQLFEVLESR